MEYSQEHPARFIMLPGARIGLGDARHPGGPVLAFTPGEWLAFTRDITEPTRSQAEEIERHSGRFPATLRAMEEARTGQASGPFLNEDELFGHLDSLGGST